MLAEAEEWAAGRVRQRRRRHGADAERHNDLYEQAFELAKTRIRWCGQARCWRMRSGT